MNSLIRADAIIATVATTPPSVGIHADGVDVGSGVGVAVGSVAGVAIGVGVGTCAISAALCSPVIAKSDNAGVSAEKRIDVSSSLIFVVSNLSQPFAGAYRCILSVSLVMPLATVHDLLTVKYMVTDRMFSGSILVVISK